VVLLNRVVGREEPGPYSTTCLLIRIIGKVDPAACLHLPAVADWFNDMYEYRPQKHMKGGGDFYLCKPLNMTLSQDPKNNKIFNRYLHKC
jgi:hypothetical protein